jgi:N-sulfoglucosamine sulfohydrolase
MRKIFLLCCIIPLITAFHSDNKSFLNKPNILWITCEDMSPHLGCYGEKVAKTPNLDAFSKESTRYSNVFSTAGVCAPSRSAIITGCYQTSIGTQHMRTPKVSQLAIQDYPKDFVGYSAVIPAEVKCFSELLRKGGYFCTNNSKQDYQFEPPVTAWDESSGNAHWRNRTDKTQPFFSIFNLMVSHESQVWLLAKEPLLVKPEDVEVPPYYPDCPEVRLDIARFLTNVMLMDKQVGKIIQDLKDDGLYENTIIFFYSDHGDGLPNAKRELYDRGLKVPLLIRIPKEMQTEQVDSQLISFVDLAPTVLSLAGVQIPTYVQGQAFLGSQKAKNPRKYIFAARDRMDSEYDQVRAVSDGRFKYLRNFMPVKPYYQNIRFRLNQPSMRAILKLRDEGKLNKEQMLWFRETKENEELFDTQNDPNELIDLARNPQYSKQLTLLRGQMDNWLKQYGDMGNIPEMEMVKNWWGGSLENGSPKTEKPVLQENKGKFLVTCTTKGASIAYKKSQKATWQVYKDGIVISPNDSVYVMAHRIGFKPSEILFFKRN